MLQSIQINTKALETMLFIWASIKDREKVSEAFLDELAQSQEMTSSYDDEFNAASVRKVLSAISNRERLNGPTKKESRFWNYNMWMLEDPQMTQMMLTPIKTLNMDDLKNSLGSAFPYENVEVIFYPGQFEVACIKGSQLFINFFTVKADLFEEGKVTIDGTPLKEFVAQKIQEMK
ncbi:hypothetical protein ABB02_01598 [Clostridiaceae bacterium JG1575]|nr:hypothetical protein ABB02_01598 [Clostridiaceae bacterium JG1575]